VISECLEAFKQANGEYPDRIMLFRDGVGEGQIKYVMENEVETMKVSFLLALVTP